ncbi:MAG: VacJ family lipoprotein [Pseudomonadales bacterium]|nr:VacJ family lipoprotein [Pseudomonadales bacterium]
MISRVLFRFAFGSQLTVAFALLLLAGNGHASMKEKSDPLEGFNRASYWLTDEFDQLVFRPIAVLYDRVLPQAGQLLVANFYANLLEIPSFTGEVLQGKWRLAGKGAGRFVINTSLGAVGFFDVATRLGFERHNEDMGQTLGYWRVPAGPYLFIPLLGPSTVRDSAGLFVDLFIVPYRYLDAMSVRNTLYGLDFVHKRDKLLEVEKHILGDKYIFMRDFYLNRRARLIRDGAELDLEEADFGDDFDEAFE